MNKSPVSPISPGIEQIGREIVAGIYEALITDGHVNTEGKSEEEIMKEVRKKALKWSKQRPMFMAVNMQNHLLMQARKLKRRREHHEAILYYATWFEHWINGILLRNSRLLNESDGCQMVRDVNLRGKYTWLLALVHGKRIPARHLGTILHICNIRNEFVHYKYKPTDVDTWKDEEKPLRLAQQKGEAAIRYLSQFELHHFFRGSSRQVLRKLRGTQPERDKFKKYKTTIAKA